ncbi:MAG: type II toxin-antitoxin system RelB/DinJ family antitoxin [Acholeplasmatales bacterium]|nr:type II toxin-antitoxin system RelB/DinJ family antitoxin [Acholeplasmatales bacterium]
MANVNVRIDDSIKKEAERILAKIGLNPTTAITLFYNQIIRTNSIPFELKIDEPNEDTINAIQEVEDYETKMNKARTFYTLNELMEDLKK